MKHKEIEKKLLLYLGGELSKHEMAAIQEHLEHCSSCKENLHLLSEVWREEAAVKRENPSPFLWTRLQAQIEEYERKQNLFTDFFEQLVRLVRPAFILLLLAGGIVLGAYLGNVPGSNRTQQANSQSAAQDEERFFNSIYLDSFHDLPPESLGGVYATLASNETGR